MSRLITGLLLASIAYVVFSEEDEEPTYVIRRTRQAAVPVETSKVVFLSSVEHIPNSEANKRIVQRQANGYQTPPNGAPHVDYSTAGGQAPPPDAGSLPVQGATPQFNNGGQQGELTSGTGTDGGQQAPPNSGAGGESGTGSGGSGSGGSAGAGQDGSGGADGSGSNQSGAESGNAGGPGSGGSGTSGGAGEGASGSNQSGDGGSGAGGAASGGTGGSGGGSASSSNGAAQSSKGSAQFHGDAASLEKGDYSFGERQALPPGCFINESGFVCCNKQLNDALMASHKRISSEPKFSKCAIQKLINTMHKDMEGQFKMDLKSLVGLQDYAQRVRFRGNMICKIEAGDRFIISYAGPGPLIRRKREAGFNETAEFGDLNKITSMLF